MRNATTRNATTRATPRHAQRHDTRNATTRATRQMQSMALFVQYNLADWLVFRYTLNKAEY